MNREANVGDGALAEPRDEVEARGGGERHDADEQEQIFEPAGDPRGARGAEALVDDQFEGPRHARGGGSGNDEGQSGERDPTGVVAGKAPDHAETGNAAAAGARWRGGHAARLAGRGRGLNDWRCAVQYRRGADAKEALAGGAFHGHIG